MVDVEKPIATYWMGEQTRVDLFPGQLIRIWQLSGGQVWLTLAQLSLALTFAAQEIQRTIDAQGGK